MRIVMFFGLVGIVVLAAASSAAAASQIVYRCGANLCRIEPQTGSVRQLTFDGQPEAGYYSDPQLSRDGRTLTYALEFDYTSVLLVARADGSRRQMIVSGPVTSPVLSPSGRWLVYQDGSPRRAHGEESRRPRLMRKRVRSFEPPRPAFAPRSPFADLYLGYLGWYRGRLFVGAIQPEALGSREGFCVVLPGPRGCGRFLALTAFPRSMGQATVSPDGRHLATVVTPRGVGPVFPSQRGTVRVYDTRTARLARVLSAGGGDSAPVWSPDGRWIAFNRGGRADVSTGRSRASIYVVPADGGAPPRRLVRGVDPTWGRA